ncbi:MAG: Rpn family recombination-promoting nuclease/putative transposase [Planctomycetota bacterium]
MTSPHDALFCQVFADPAHAAGELRAVLPPAIATSIDWATLRLLSPVDKDVSRGDRHVDLLFAAAIGDEDVLLQLLLEHKSYVDRFAAVQIGEYMFRVLRRYVRENPRARRLPPVLSIVVYHGRELWNGGDDLRSCFGLSPETQRCLDPHLPQLRFFVDDLSLVRGEELATRTLSALARLVLEVLRWASSPVDLASLLRRLAAEFRAARDAGGDVGLLAAVLTYLGKVRDRPRAEMQRLVRLELGPDVEEIMASTYEQTLNEGRAQGRAQGRVQGVAEGLAAALRTVLGSRFGNLDGAVVARIAQAAVEDLERWLRRAATVERIEDVFA